MASRETRVIKIRVELNLSGGNRGEGRALASEDLFVARMETAPLREQAQVLLAELDRPAAELHRVRALLERGARREGPAAAAEILTKSNVRLLSQNLSTVKEPEFSSIQNFFWN